MALSRGRKLGYCFSTTCSQDYSRSHDIPCKEAANTSSTHCYALRTTWLLDRTTCFLSLSFTSCSLEARQNLVTLSEMNAINACNTAPRVICLQQCSSLLSAKPWHKTEENITFNKRTPNCLPLFSKRIQHSNDFCWIYMIFGAISNLGCLLYMRERAALLMPTLCHFI